MITMKPSVLQTTKLACAICACAWGALVLPAGAASNDVASVEVTDTQVSWVVSDGIQLQGKLSLPAGATQPVPVVYYLHGAGPRDYDNTIHYRDPDGKIRTFRFFDYYSRELARLGMGFFRMSKRGCTNNPTGPTSIDRSVFAKATPSVLLDDYATGLEVLRRRKEVDANRIVLHGSSEGTRLAPQLARRAPAGIKGLVLTAFQSDNQHDTVVWQNTVGPWRNVEKLIPAAAGGALTRKAYDDAVKLDATVGARLPFATFDTDTNGVMTVAELTNLVRPRLEAILSAVERRDDDYLGKVLMNLSSGYLLDDWKGPPTSTYLLKLDLPIAIFHGELDGTTRVEGVRETEAAFQAAGLTNLTIRIYPDCDHELNWTALSAQGRGPLPFQDSFRAAADFVKQER